MIKFEKVRLLDYLLHRTDKTNLACRIIFVCAFLDLMWCRSDGLQDRESWSMVVVPQCHSCRIYDWVLGLRWCNRVKTLLIPQECLKIDLVLDR